MTREVTVGGSCVCDTALCASAAAMRGEDRERCAGVSIEQAQQIHEYIKHQTVLTGLATAAEE